MRAARAGAKTALGVSGRVPGWLTGLLCGAALTLAPSFAITLAVLLFPGLLAQALDRTHGKPAARSMLLFGGCGCVGPMRDLWATGEGGRQAMAAVRDVLGADVIAICWLGAAGGWLLFEMAPIVTQSLADFAEERRMQRLLSERLRYQQEWEIAPPE